NRQRPLELGLLGNRIQRRGDPRMSIPAKMLWERAMWISLGNTGRSGKKGRRRWKLLIDETLRKNP
ncbi:unnamed protein product, partial [Musa hybrid cultivar]